jgi:hypothetical protein
MRFSEVISRITGIDTPIFGVSWQPDESEVSIAGRVIAALEDRRVLYSPSEVEVPEHCVESILHIRCLLTKEISSAKSASPLQKHLRAMRAACRKFLDSIGERHEGVVMRAQHGGWASWVFISALGELRGTFGHHIAALASAYGLDVEDQLATILPGADNDM